MAKLKYHHIVLFRVHDDVEDAQVVEALEALRSLGHGHNGLERWLINLSIDSRKGRIIIEEALFADEAAYHAFRVSPQHVKVGETMRQIADWFVGDYES